MKDQIWVGDEKPRKQKFKEISENNEIINKPKGGFWTCDHILDGKYLSDWVEFCNIEEFFISGEEAWRLEVVDDVDVVVLDGKEKVKDFYEKYGKRDYEDVRYLDYVEISKNYDGLKITNNVLSDFDFCRVKKYNLHGWDVESTVWFDWCFNDVKHLGNIREGKNL